MITFRRRVSCLKLVTPVHFSEMVSSASYSVMEATAPPDTGTLARLQQAA